MRHYHVDRIISLETGVRATGVRSVALSDDVFAEHFPGNPVLPGVYLLEGMAQTAGVLLWESSRHARLAVMERVDHAQFTAFVRPGDSVRYDIEIEMFEERVARARGTATVGDREVATATLTFSMQYVDRVIPPPYRTHWEQVVAIWLGHYPGEDGGRA